MYKPGETAGPKNSRWKGGRTVASHGYVLILRPDHPHADCRGYIYEHRLVAEQKLGRRLLPDEVIHHIDGDKQNNDPANLEIMATSWHHRAKHRKKPGRRLPGEDNPVISCICGCGGRFPKYDQSGRPRRYISGHNLYSPGPSYERCGIGPGGKVGAGDAGDSSAVGPRGITILALDLSWQHTGWVVLDDARPDPVVAYGTLNPTAAKGRLVAAGTSLKGFGQVKVKDLTDAENLAFCALALQNQVTELIEGWHPAQVVYEKTDWHQNLSGRGDWKEKYAKERTAQRALSRGETVLALVCLKTGVRVESIGAVEVKRMFGGTQKGQIASCVALICPDRFKFTELDCNRWLTDRRTGMTLPDHVSDALAVGYAWLGKHKEASGGIRADNRKKAA